MILSPWPEQISKLDGKESGYKRTIISLIQQDSMRSGALAAVAELKLNDWCIGAGFVRNCIWDYIHGYHVSSPLNDIDVCYYDASCLLEEKDSYYESMLEESIPGVNWSVSNQARMHLYNQCPPYESTIDAMKYWPEIQTVIGVSQNKDNNIVIHSVFPLEHTFSMQILKNPYFKSMEKFHSRVKSKKWLETWPKLTFPELQI